MTTDTSTNVWEIDPDFRAVFETIPDAIVIVNENAQIVRVNAQTEALFLYSRDELLGKAVEILIPEQFWRQHIGRRSEYLVNPHLRPMSTVLGMVGRQKDGHVIPLDIMLNSLKTDNGSLTIVVTRDMTEQKQAEEEIIRLASFPQLNPEPIIEIDLAGSVTYLNPSARRQLPGLAIADTEHPALEGLALVVAAFQSGQEERVVREVELDDHAYEQRISYIPEHGVIRIYMVDIMQRRQLQRQLTQADRLVSIGILVSGVAHEVNNPLNGAMGRAQLLLRGDLEPAMRRDLQVIQDEIERAVRTMRNLLSFARDYKSEKLYTSINVALESALELRRYELTVSNIEITADLQEDLPRTMADAHQLQQVFLNLLVNAEQAIVGASRTGVISLKTRLVGGTIQVTITDGGPGMTEKVMARIFDPFYTTKAIGQGTGLGLSICYGIVQEHGGDIRVDSRVGEGITFTIELPVIADS